MTIAKCTFFLLVCAMLFGCTRTSFNGSAFVENDRTGCEAKCRGQGMAVAGLVYMGEYSSACVCEVPRATGAASRRVLLSAATSAAGGSAAVMVQQQNDDDNNSHHSAGWHHY